MAGALWGNSGAKARTNEKGERRAVNGPAECADGHTPVAISDTEAMPALNPAP
jgi:hypothetical protein